MSNSLYKDSEKRQAKVALLEGNLDELKEQLEGVSTFVKLHSP